ncbi:hypothetical protein GINT2_000514 [Glugoides intestinalis]
MQEIDKVKSETVVCYTSQERVPTLKMLKKLAESNSGVVVAISGQKGSGRRTFVRRAIQDLGKPTRTLNINEVLKDGKLDTQKFRKVLRSTTDILIREHLKVIEGEVISITNRKLQLKTMDMESVFDVGVRMQRELQRERVCVGDVIKIYKESCFVTRLGRSSERCASSRSQLLPKVIQPEGECIKTEVVVTKLTLDELDLINHGENWQDCFYENIQVNTYISNEVDKNVSKLLKEGKAGINTGCIVFSECDMLNSSDIEKIVAISSELFTPTVFLIFDHKPSKNKFGEVQIHFNAYTQEELSEIIKKQSEAICTDFCKETLDILIHLAEKKGLCTAIRVLKAALTTNNSLPVTSLNKIVSMFDN